MEIIPTPGAQNTEVFPQPAGKITVSAKNPDLVFKWIHFQQANTDYNDSQPSSKNDTRLSGFGLRNQLVRRSWLDTDDRLFLPLGVSRFNDTALEHLYSGVLLAPEFHQYRLATFISRSLPIRITFGPEAAAEYSQLIDRLFAPPGFGLDLNQAAANNGLPIIARETTHDTKKALEIEKAGNKSQSPPVLVLGKTFPEFFYEGLTSDSQAQFISKYREYAQYLELIIQVIYQQMEVTPQTDLDHVLEPADYAEPQVLALQRKLKRQALEFWKEGLIKEDEFFDMTLEKPKTKTPIGFPK